MGHIRLRLRECMDEYEARTGIRLSYTEVAAETGLSVATLQSLGSRDAYNTTLRVVERLCDALGVSTADLLEWIPDGESPLSHGET